MMARKFAGGSVPTAETETKAAAEAKAEADLYGLAQFWDGSDDAIITCPYDSTHRIRRFRVERHLHLCKKNHPDVKVAVCPYNATHVLPQKLFVDHVVGCPDIRLVDPDQGMVRSDGGYRARVFRGIGTTPHSSTVMSRPQFEPVPSQRLACLRDGDEKTVEKKTVEDYSLRPPTGIVRTFHDKQSLKDVMRANSLNYTAACRAFVENDVIAGGAEFAPHPEGTEALQSLYSCGGVLPAPSIAEEEEADSAVKSFNEILGVLEKTPFSSESPSTDGQTDRRTDGQTVPMSAQEIFAARFRRFTQKNTLRSEST